MKVFQSKKRKQNKIGLHLNFETIEHAFEFNYTLLTVYFPGN
jgi:hypothetical protein